MCLRFMNKSITTYLTIYFWISLSSNFLTTQLAISNTWFRKFKNRFSYKSFVWNLNLKSFCKFWIIRFKVIVMFQSILFCNTIIEHCFKNARIIIIICLQVVEDTVINVVLSIALIFPFVAYIWWCTSNLLYADINCVEDGFGHHPPQLRMVQKNNSIWSWLSLYVNKYCNCEFSGLYSLKIASTEYCCYETSKQHVF